MKPGIPPEKTHHAAGVGEDFTRAHPVLPNQPAFMRKSTPLGNPGPLSPLQPPASLLLFFRQDGILDRHLPAWFEPASPCKHCGWAVCYVEPMPACAGTTARESSVSQERSEVVVIRAVDFSETSRIVTFLSPERGKLACMAAGARRPKSQLAGMLDTFNRLEVVYYWKDGRSVQKLGEASLLDGFGALKADLEKSAYAAFPLEFVYKTAQENEPSHALYEALLTGLDGMRAWQGPARVHAAWQVVQLLRVAGFEPDLKGGEEGKRSAGFSFDAGVVSRGERVDRSLRIEDLDRLRHLAGARDRCPVVDDSPEVFQAVCGYVTRQLESEFRSLRVIAQMFP